MLKGSKKTLAEQNGKLAREWDLEKNAPLTPSQVAPFSNKKVWWRCSMRHSWEASIVNRSKGRGCPFCANRIISPENSLQAKNPELAKEWHPSRNGSLTPAMVPPSGARRVWWMCKKGHEWEQKVNNRSSGTGCPFCAGKRVNTDNSFASKFPDIAKQWDTSKNKGLTPDNVTWSSGKKIWWVCSRNHSYACRVAERAIGRGCPTCHDQTSILEIRLFAELKKIFSDVKHRHKISGIECDVYLPEMKLAIEVDGNYWHRKRKKEDARKNRELSKNGVFCLRVRGDGLGKIDKSDVLLSKAQESRPDYRTIILILDGITCLGIEIGFKSKIQEYKKHGKFLNESEFLRILNGIEHSDPNRTLAKRSSQLVKEWHVDKNHPLTPEQVSAKSSLKVWWICENKHEWEATVSNRVSGTGCPYCSGRVATIENNLLLASPDIAAEWHPKKNGIIGPGDVTPKSNKTFWWICKKKHEWKAKPNDRSRGRGCPICSKRKIHPDNSLGKLAPKTAMEWHPTRNGKLTPFDVFPSSAKEYWWLCKNRHEWKESPNSREGRSCPYCSKTRVSRDYNLKKCFPDMAAQWHPKLNKGVTPEKVFPSSNTPFWWLCKKGHEWKESPNSRDGNDSCPTCTKESIQKKKKI